MASVYVACFVEDVAQEAYLRALLERLAALEGVAVSIRFASARGGSGTTTSQFIGFQRAQQRGLAPTGRPEMLVIMVDADCRPFREVRRDLLSAIDGGVFVESAVAVPSSHVESWYIADEAANEEVIGVARGHIANPCAPDVFKNRLAQMVKEGLHPATLGGVEFAQELVAAMDLDTASRADASLSAAVEDIRAALRRAARLVA